MYITAMAQPLVWVGHHPLVRCDGGILQVTLDFIFVCAVLQQILKELKTNTQHMQHLNERVTNVEAKLSEPGVMSSKPKGKQATPPSRQLRVSVLVYPQYL